MDFREKTIENKEIFKGHILGLRKDVVSLPNGKTAFREVVEHPGAVCVAALTQDKEIVLVKQYRYAVSNLILELPAGKLEKDEIPLAAAKRELTEETGIIGEDFKSLGYIYVSPGYSSEIIYLYTCKVEAKNEMNLDEDEFLEPVYLKFDLALKMVLDDEIHDAKTQICILKLARHLAKEKFFK